MSLSEKFLATLPPTEASAIRGLKISSSGFQVRADISEKQVRDQAHEIARLKRKIAELESGININSS